MDIKDSDFMKLDDKEFLEFKRLSLEFIDTWYDYKHSEDHAKYLIVQMVVLLEKNGYTRTEAIQQIVETHKHLRGFSTTTIYRELPDEMKNKNLGRPNLPNDKLGEPNNNNPPLNYDYEDDDNTEQTNLVVDIQPGFEDLPQLIDENEIDPDNLNKTVVQYAEEVELSPNKLKMLNNKTLNEHPKLQKDLIEQIAPLSIKDAKVKVAQKKLDIETGAMIKTEYGYASDPDKREEVEAKPKIVRVKHPGDYYLELLKLTDKIMYLGTNYDANATGDVFYDKQHIESSQKYRFNILEGLTDRELLLLEKHIESLQDLLYSLTFEIDETIKNKKK
ncbi:MAG: hypothetical protein MRJ93_12930 [Nitrososphaeraceae archaeon]|nr:hypothetical protein [Nitrososphaeraceae archaeon]